MRQWDEGRWRGFGGWRLAGCLAALALAVGSESGALPEAWQRDGDTLVLRNGTAALPVSLRSPQFEFSVIEQTVGGAAPERVEAGRDALRVTYPPQALPGGGALDAVLHLEWSAKENVLRKWAEYRLTGMYAPAQICSVVLDAFDANLLTAPFAAHPPRSMPAFLDGFFAGIEFPVAATRVEGDRLIVGHKPFMDVLPEVRYRTRTAVYGLVQTGDARQAFHQYIERHRPAPKGLHFNYNSWWTTPAPFSEADVLGLMKVFEENLYKAHRISFDTFTIDMGWSDANSIWGINRELFPDGFAHIQKGAERMGSHLGLWTSPSSFYGPALDNEWAQEAGYGTFTLSWGEHEVRLLSLGDERYAAAFREQLAGLIRRYDIRQVKLDGFFLGYDYMAGPHSAEQTAEGGIAAFEAMREANPDVWLECTFDAQASPWWLFHLNSLIGMFGDDSPHGRVPCPVYRESYTTARDFYNLQGADRLPSPIPAQEILGIIHQSPDDFMNDAVTTLLRGHAFLPMYINPKYMDPVRWTRLAHTLKWARNNQTMLVDRGTRPLRPTSWPADAAHPALPQDAPMPREPYGYAHWDGATGLVLLRNPWIAPQSYRIVLGGDLVAGSTLVHVVSLYPEPRVYGLERAVGEPFEVPLTSYETVVLSIGPEPPAAGVSRVEDCIGGAIEVGQCAAEVKGVRFDAVDERMGPDWTLRITGDAMMDAHLTAEVALGAPHNRFFLLLEGAEAVPTGETVFAVDGRDVSLRVNASTAGFAASGLAPPEHWTFFEADLSPGTHTLELSAVLDTFCTRLSAWIWATRDGADASPSPNALPEPEIVSLGATALLEPVEIGAIAFTEGGAPPTERIDGIFLDALEPASVSQSWGELQRNRSVWERPLTIGSKRYVRGLGTHAASHIVYALDGAYRRFEAEVGPDGANRGTVTFEVRVDGVVRWQSGLMTRTDDPRRVEVDITSARELTLVVGDGGDGVACDHANWADAKLLR